MPNTGIDGEKSVEQIEGGNNVIVDEVVEQTSDTTDRAMEVIEGNNMLDGYNEEELGLLFGEEGFIDEVIKKGTDEDILRLITNPDGDHLSFIKLGQKRGTKEMYESIIKEDLWLSRVLYMPLVQFCGEEGIKYIQED